MRLHGFVAATIAVAVSVALQPAVGAAAPAAPAITIRPVVQTVAGTPGLYRRTFELSYSGRGRARVSVNVEELDLMTGKILQAPANTAREWVTLDRRALTLRRGTRRKVRASVRVPRSHDQRRRRIGVVFTISTAAGDEVVLKTRIIASIHVFSRRR